MQSVTYEPIRHDEYAVVDQLIESQDYFLPALERTGMPLDQFRQSVRTVGSVSVIRLAETGAGKADRIELGVHRANVRAIALYEREGFRTVRVLDDLDFLVMQKQLTA
jgi:hypothetical protein